MDRLYGEYEYTFQDVQRTRGMHFVQKYLRMKHVIVFKLSHDVLQVRVRDRTPGRR
jgi:cell cycle serine/threonine-protein kinase CDC5/MSD2